MNHIVKFDNFDESRIVYIRDVRREDLPAEVQQDLPETGRLVAVHDANGQQLALVANRDLAFVLARQHNMAPVSVH